MAPPAERGALRNWFYGFAPPERGTVVLGHRRVYIVPTRLGWLFGGTLGPAAWADPEPCRTVAGGQVVLALPLALARFCHTGPS